jgi:Xaa-Pro dipeptidase
MSVEEARVAAGTPDFDVPKLDALLEAANVDALVATSRHNVRYLAGDYSQFFLCNTAIADEQCLLAFAFVRGRVDQAVFVATPQEADQFEVARPWAPTVDLAGFTTVDTARVVAQRLAERGLATATIGIEEPFAPSRFYENLVLALPHATFIDISSVLNELRSVKRP